MSTAKTTTIQIEIPSPPDTHFLLPQEWKGKVKFQEGDRVYSAEHGWCELYPDGILKNSLAVARLRPRNPQGLSDDVFRKLPMDARALSDAELKRLKELGGLVVEDEKLLGLLTLSNVWSAGYHGGYTKDYAYATMHPANYYLELPDSAFVLGKLREEAEQLVKAKATLPEGCELVTDLDYLIKEGDWVWNDYRNYWENAARLIGKKRNIAFPFVARPIATPVFKDESFINTYNKPKAEEEPEEQHPEEDTTQDRPHTFGSCPRHGFVRMKGCREVRPFCITEKGITPFQRAFRDWVRAMDTLDYSADGHKWGKFAQKGAK